MGSGMSMALIHSTFTRIDFSLARAAASASGSPLSDSPSRYIRFQRGAARSAASSDRNSGRRRRLMPRTSALPPSAFNATAAAATYSA